MSLSIHTTLGCYEYTIGDTINGVGMTSMVIADGRELQLIRKQFSNIPMTTNHSVRWNDADAQFIVDNIDLKQIPDMENI